MASAAADKVLDKTLQIDRSSLLPYLAIQIHSFTTIALFVFLSATQSFLIIYTYNVNPRTIGYVMGQLSVADEVVSILSLVFWGGLSDRIGRHKVLMLGYAITTLSLFMLPLGVLWSPDLLLTRMLFAFGTSSMSAMMAAMIADVVQPKGLPRATAFAGIMSGVGALVAAFGFLGLGVTYCMKIVYFIVAGICAGLGIVVCALYRDPLVVVEDKPTMPQVVLGFASIPKLAMQNPFLGLAILGSFGARMCSTVGSTYISSWYQYYMMYTSMECPRHGDPALYANATSTFCGLDTRCAKAVSVASATNGILQTLALVGAPFVAIIMECVRDTSHGMLMACIVSAFAFSFMVTVKNPRNMGQISGVVAAMGFGQIFMIISTQVMLIRNMHSPQMRGTISAAYSVVGAFGVITIGVGGGELFDSGFHQGPFLVTGIVCAILAVLTLVLIVIYRPSNNRKTTEEKEVEANNKITVAELQKDAAVADVETKA